MYNIFRPLAHSHKDKITLFLHTAATKLCVSPYCVIDYNSCIFLVQGSSAEIISLGIASTGKFIMTCTDTQFNVWTLKGRHCEIYSKDNVVLFMYSYY